MAKKTSSPKSFLAANGVLPIQHTSVAASAGGTEEQITAFRDRVNLLMNSGYQVLNSFEFENPNPESPSAFSQLTANGGGISSSFGMFDSKDARPVKIDGVGTPDLGYIPWGPQNTLPTQIYNLAANLPYTAAAIKYLSDLTLGNGPKLMYHFIGLDGKKVENIEYGDAGKRILAEVSAIRDKIEKRDAEAVANQANGGGSHLSSDKKELGSLEYFLEEYTKDYKEWERTNEEYQRFIKYNDLNNHYMKCAIDDMHLDIYFPTIGLSIGKKREAWQPKIVKVGFLPASCCRLEKKDKHQKINNVFYNEDWRSASSGTMVNDKNAVAYPSLMQEDFMAKLEKTVEKNQNVAVGRRPTWFCCPIIYPSMHKPYYPQPSWWSIFPTKTYDYATTLITDKAIARENSTMWGKMVFINLEYFRQICDDAGADTAEEKGKIRAQLMKSVNEFLSRKQNNGKALVADMYPAGDNKSMLKSIEIVDIPPLAQGRDMKDELEEVSSIIFFAIGVHPALIGAVPGAKSSSGGTFQRELHLLKQTQMSPRQKLYLRFLDNISKFNGWDSKAQWQISMPVLTTLDRNKTGIEEME